MGIRAYWDKIKGRYDALTLRERGMVSLAAVGGVLMAGSTLLVEPELARVKSLRANIERQQRDLTLLQAQTGNLRDQARQDPDAGKKSELENLRAKISDADERLSKAEGAFVPPERMTAVLESLLRKNPSLRLVRFKTLEASGLLGQLSKKVEGAFTGTEFDLFSHGVEIQIEGTYADLSSYVAQLEQGPNKFLWGDVRLSVVEYPKAQLTLVIYTLSADKTWLAI